MKRVDMLEDDLRQHVLHNPLIQPIDYQPDMLLIALARITQENAVILTAQEITSLVGLITEEMQGSFWVWAQPMRDDVTL